MMVQQQICILLPTKNRLEDFRILADSWTATTQGNSIIVLGLDDNDHTYDDILGTYPFIVERFPPQPFLSIVNNLATKYCQLYPYIAFMEDDCKFITPGWEEAILAELREHGDNAVVYVNDLINRERLVGLPFIHSTMIKRLGFMSPPGLKAIWFDYFWKDVGVLTNSLHYLPDIVIEHRNYTTGKRAKDQVACDVEAQGLEDVTNNRSYHNFTNRRRLRTYVITQLNLSR